MGYRLPITRSLFALPSGSFSHSLCSCRTFSGSFKNKMVLNHIIYYIYFYINTAVDLRFCTFWEREKDILCIVERLKCCNVDAECTAHFFFALRKETKSLRKLHQRPLSKTIAHVPIGHKNVFHVTGGPVVKINRDIGGRRCSRQGRV